MSRGEWKLGCKVYIGNLSDGASKADIEDAFSKYGPLRNVWVARNPPGFAFVEFQDERDAESACRHLDGTRIGGSRVKIEKSHGRTRGRSFGGRNFGGRDFGRGRPNPMDGPYIRGRPTYPRRNYDGDYYGPPSGHHPGGHQYMDRRPNPNHPPKPRSPLGMKCHYARSRSHSLGKSPPPQPRTARPRTPPSRTVSPERY